MMNINIRLQSHSHSHTTFAHKTQDQTHEPTTWVALSLSFISNAYKSNEIEWYIRTKNEYQWAKNWRKWTNSMSEPPTIRKRWNEIQMKKKKRNKKEERRRAKRMFVLCRWNQLLFTATFTNMLLSQALQISK